MMNNPPQPSGVLKDVEDLANHFQSLPSPKPVYRFKPSAFVSYNTHGCPLQLRLDNPADHTSATPDSGEAPRRSTASRHKERGIYLEDALVKSLGDRVVKCDSEENKDYPFSHWMMEFSNQPNRTGRQEWLLFQLKLEFPDTLVDKIFAKLPEQLREQTRSRMIFRPMYPDLIKLRRVLNETTNTQEIEVTAMDIKSSSRMKGGHQLQVATYHHVINAMLKEQEEGQPWSYRMNTKGEVWIPKRTQNSDVVDFESETFTIETVTPFLDSFFKTIVPSIVCYNPDEPDAKYKGIEWTLKDSCVMCPHVTDCKARAQKEGLVQLLPGITEKDRDWLPEKLKDLNSNAEHFKMKHRVRALTRGGTVTSAFKQKLPIFRLQDGAVSFRLPNAAALSPIFIACTVVTDPFDGTFVYGSFASMVVEGGMMMEVKEPKATTHPKSFVEDLSGIILEANRGGMAGSIKLVVWNEPQKSALIKVCCANGFDALKETFQNTTAFAAENAQKSADGLHQLTDHVLSLSDAVNEVTVLPVAGKPTLRETLYYLSDPLMCQGNNASNCPRELEQHYPFTVEHQQNIDDYWMETSSEVRRNNNFKILFGFLSIVRNLVLQADTLTQQPFRAPSQPWTTPSSLHSSVVASSSQSTTTTTATPLGKGDEGKLLDLMEKAIVYDACSKMSDRINGRQKRYMVRLASSTPAIGSGGTDAGSPGTLTIRMELLNQDHASEINADLKLAAADGPLCSPSCQGPDGSRAPVKMAVCRGGNVEKSPVDKFKACEGAYYWMCTKCNNEKVTKNSKKDEWLPVDCHPRFGDGFSGMGSWVLEKEDSSGAVDDVTMYNKLPAMIKLPSGSGLMFVDISDVNAAEGTICLVRRTSGIIIQPGKVYYLTQRFSDFNVSKGLGSIKSLKSMPEMASKNPLLQLALGETWDKKDLVPIPLEPIVESEFTKPALSFYAHTLRNPLTVLWGPPGTGKTQTLTNSITEWAKAKPDVRILVVSMTHKAIAELVERRVTLFEEAQKKGSDGHRPVPANFQFTHIKEGQKDNVFVSTGEAAPALSGEKVLPVDPVNGCAVYCTIWEAYKRWLKPASSTAKPKPPQPMFDILVIDEASQMPFAFSLIPSCLMKPNSRIILSGDLLQLPPIFNQFKDATPQEKPFLASAIQAVLRNFEGQQAQTPFDILEGHWKNLCQLTISYRSSPAIVDFVAGLYPEGIGANFTQKYSLSAEVEDDHPTNRHKFAPANTEMLESPLCTVSGVKGAQEGQMICNILQDLNNAYEGQPGKKVMVVTPHRRQRDEIRRRVRMMDLPALGNDVVIDTAEKMQGSQAHFVIFALAAVNAASSFIFDVYRLNVAFSRAQQQVILVASDQTLCPPSSCLDTAEGRYAFTHLSRFVEMSKKIPGKNLQFQ